MTAFGDGLKGFPEREIKDDLWGRVGRAHSIPKVVLTWIQRII